jgi:sugar phosphate isomerase/epimerase
MKIKSPLKKKGGRERMGGCRVYVSIRDDILLYGGFGSLSHGLSELGLNALEVGLTKDLRAKLLEPVDGRSDLELTSEESIAFYKAHLSERGVAISALLLSNDFNAKDLESELSYVVKAIRIAEKLGVGAIRIDSAMRGEREMGFEERVERFSGCLARIIEVTDGSSVALGIENHGYQGNDPSFLKAVIDKVGSQRLGLTLDTGNFYWAGYPIDEVHEILKSFSPYVKHTHIKNIKYPDEVKGKRRDIGWEYGRYVCPIPDGDVDHSKVIGFLKEVGYEGDLCVEDESLGKFGVSERREVLMRDVLYLKGLL